MTNEDLVADDLTSGLPQRTTTDDTRLVWMAGAGDQLLAVLVDDELSSALVADAEALNSFIDHLANGAGIGAATMNAFDTPPGERALLAVLGFTGRVEDYFDAYGVAEELLGRRMAGWDAYQRSPGRHHARWLRDEPLHKRRNP